MAKNRALSEFLTERRAAISPESAGIATSGPRRVPGLRREEVAVLAGVSSDWYQRLEQGRPVVPSEAVLAAIARVLQLDDAEHDYLVNLARPEARRPATGEPTVRPGIVRMLDALEGQAAFVLGPRMEVLAGNPLAWALLEDFPARPAEDRNLLRWVATDPRARELYVDWADILSDLVGVLQLEASAAPRDPQIRALAEELEAGCPEFGELWATPRPTGRTSGTKRFRHSDAGALAIDWEAFTVPEDPSQTLFVYTASDDSSARALRGLVAVSSPGSAGTRSRTWVRTAPSTESPASAETAARRLLDGPPR